MNGLILRVRIFRWLLFLGLCLCTMAVVAQDEETPRRGSRVIDDTTKQVYGPRTSRYYYEDDIFFNRYTLSQVDTAIRDFHRFDEVMRHENMYQDLGTVGTALRPIYYEVPDLIGVQPGFNAYDKYWEREKIRYWDTKSPYTNMYVILGGRGRSITRATYSRNISPNWNFGLTYRAMFIDKQISKLGKGDRLVRSQYYDFFTTYQTKDSTYRVFVNFRRQNHQVAEGGGVRVFEPFEYEDFFSIDAQPKLGDAISKDLRMNIHLYHQYSPGEGLQVYHKFDRYRQGNGFTDFPAREPTGYFDYFELRSDTTNDYSKFTSLRNEAGIKGSLLKMFYNGYYAIRNYTADYRYDTLLLGQSQNRRRGVENYLGGRIGLHLDSLLSVSGWVEYMPDGGNYRIEGNIKSKWFEATLKQVQYESTLLQQYYRSNNDYWLQNLNSINTTQLSGYLHYRSRVFRFSPGLTFTRIGNYVFFKTIREENLSSPPAPRLGEFTPENSHRSDVLPYQSSGEQVIASPMLRMDLTILRHIHLRTFGIFTRIIEESDNAISLPELFFNGQLSYENIFFNGNLDMHAGVDLHWKSPYYALAYDVPIQQFYLQGNPLDLNTPFMHPGKEGRFKTPAFPLVDVFFNAKIKRGRVFFRFNNVMQLINGEGYFPTPFYPGQRNSFDFGFDWSFYD